MEDMTGGVEVTITLDAITARLYEEKLNGGEPPKHPDTGEPLELDEVVERVFKSWLQRNIEL